jgi:isocitrate dehydrogenase
VDLFADWAGTSPDELAKKLQEAELDNVQLTMITNRGVKVWPNGFDETFCTDHWRCRFAAADGYEMSPADIIKILDKGHLLGIDFIKSENLYQFDGRAAYSLGQGQ